MSIYKLIYNITMFRSRRFIIKKYGAEEMLPGICAVDYIVAHYMGNGFSRTKTLGAGDDCCNCHYELKGICPLQVPAEMK